MTEFDKVAFEDALIVDMRANDGAELWSRHVQMLPQFAEYPEKAGRVIPMIRLRPVDAG